MPDDDDYDDLDRTKLGVEPYAAAASTKSERTRPYLLVLAGPHVGEMFPINAVDTVIGRGEQATIRLRDDSISRKHVRLVANGNEVRIEDLGSANGTVINGSRVTTSPLHDGDKIQLGATTILKFTYHDELEEDFQRQMYDAALRDPLTKAFNKKHLLEQIATELAFARRHGTPLALMMLDIDHFKRVNDTFGHLAGDQVLGTLANTIRTIVRTEDMFARYGGEEFAVVMRSASIPQAGVVAERIRATIAQTRFVFAADVIPVTVSLGVAGYPSTEAKEITDLVAAADEALYEAKRTGRNRVVVRGGVSG